MHQACLLALIAGYADTIGFLRYEAFAGLMTGNTILFGIEVATAQYSRAGYHAAIMLLFLIGVIAAQVLLRLRTPVWAALSIAAALLVICGYLNKSWAALVLPLAMGLQNSAANRFNGVALNTVFITGNIQKVGEGLLAWAWPSRDIKAPGVEAFAIFGLVWIAYGAGAVFGAVADRALSQPLLVPALVLPFVMLTSDQQTALRRLLRLNRQ